MIEDWQKKIKQRIGPKRRFAFKIARFISIAWPGKPVAFVVHFGPKSTNADETTATLYDSRYTCIASHKQTINHIGILCSSNETKRSKSNDVYGFGLVCYRKWLSTISIYIYNICFDHMQTGASITFWTHLILRICVTVFWMVLGYLMAIFCAYFCKEIVCSLHVFFVMRKVVAVHTISVNVKLSYTHVTCRVINTIRWVECGLLVFSQTDKYYW